MVLTRVFLTINVDSMRWPSQRLLKNLNRSSIRLFVSYKHIFALEHSTRIFTAHPPRLHLRDPMDSLPGLLHPPSGFANFRPRQWRRLSRLIPVFSSVIECFVSYRNKEIPPRPDCGFPTHLFPIENLTLLPPRRCGASCICSPMPA